jgi:hypothetical protein
MQRKSLHQRLTFSLLLFGCKYPWGVTKGDSLSYNFWSIISSNSFVWSSWPTWPSPSFLDHGFWKEDGTLHQVSWIMAFEKKMELFTKFLGSWLLKRRWNSSVFLVLWFIAFVAMFKQQTPRSFLGQAKGGCWRGVLRCFPKITKRLSCHTIIYLLFFFYTCNNFLIMERGILYCGALHVLRVALCTEQQLQCLGLVVKQECALTYVMSWSSMKKRYNRRANMNLNPLDPNILFFTKPIECNNSTLHHKPFHECYLFCRCLYFFE